MIRPTASDNKQTIRQFLTHFSMGNYDAAFELLDEAMEWHILIEGAGGGCNSKAKMKEQLMAARSLFSTTVAWSPVRLAAEDDYVMAEISGRGVTRGGFVYKNRYHNIFKVRDGLIVEIREMFQEAPVQKLYAALAAESRAG